MTAKENAKERIRTASKLYLQAQIEQESAHEALKAAVREGRKDGLTQQEIADATYVEQGDTGFGLSRQRISQIANEEL